MDMKTCCNCGNLFDLDVDGYVSESRANRFACSSECAKAASHKTEKGSILCDGDYKVLEVEHPIKKRRDEPPRDWDNDPWGQATCSVWAVVAFFVLMIFLVIMLVKGKLT